MEQDKHLAGELIAEIVDIYAELKQLPPNSREADDLREARRAVVDFLPAQFKSVAVILDWE